MRLHTNSQVTKIGINLQGVLLFVKGKFSAGPTHTAKRAQYWARARPMARGTQRVANELAFSKKRGHFDITSLICSVSR